MVDPHITRPATQADIARELGVSQSTVSRALRNQAVLPETIRRQIQAAAKTLGYRANASATALTYLRQSRAGRGVGAELAWIDIWPKPAKLREIPDFDHYWRGASAQAVKLGYRLVEFDATRIGSTRRLQDILVARNIDGILLPPMGNYSWDWAGFAWDRFCVVRMSRTVEEPRVHIVTADQVNNTIIALREMRSLGYRRIGLVTYGEMKVPQARWFLHGYLGAERAQPAADRIEPFQMPGDDSTASRRTFARWLKHGRPDAILADCPIASWLAGAGYRVPRDIGLASTSVLGQASTAGIYQNPEEIGRVSVLMLSSLMRDNARGSPPIFRQVLVEGCWVNGTSLPRRT